MTDGQILELIKQNSEEGAKHLIMKYYSIVKSACLQNLDNKEDIDECVNDVFTEFCLKYQEYNAAKGSLKNYLCTIAKRRSIDKYRSNLKKESIKSKILEQYKEELDSRENREVMVERLNEAMEKLEPVDKKILEKYYYEGYGYAEIAKELDMSYEAVKKRGVRGKKKLLYLILVGILVFAITACATIVMKYQGILPLWFPFYDLIPTIEREVEHANEENYTEETQILRIDEEGSELYEVEMEGITDFYYQQESETLQVKKYQLSETQGLMWSDEEAYEMRSNQQKIQIGDMIYELVSVFYQNGKWKVDFLVTCIDEGKVAGEISKDDGKSDEDKVIERLENGEWKDEGLEYLEKTYLQFSASQKYYLVLSGFKYVPTGTSGWRDCYKFTMEAKGELDTQQKKTIAMRVVLPNGEVFEIEMDKIEVKEYLSDDESSENDEKHEGNGKLENSDVKNDDEIVEEQEEVIFKRGISELKNGQAVVCLYQENTQEYGVAPMITRGYFGPINVDVLVPVLKDENGNNFNQIRTNAQMIDREQLFEIYFQGIEEGAYTLEIPYLCIQKEIKAEPVEIPLPAGEEDYRECNVPVTFEDGSSFCIQGVRRHEEMGDVYHVIGDSLVIEEQRFWNYELEYAMNMDAEVSFNVANANGITSKGGKAASKIIAIYGENKYVLQTENDELAESMTVEFYNPLYIWNRQITLDVEF